MALKIVTGLNVRDDASSSFAEPFRFKTIYLRNEKNERKFKKPMILTWSTPHRWCTMRTPGATFDKAAYSAREARERAHDKCTHFMNASFHDPSFFHLRQLGRNRRAKASSQSAAGRLGRVASNSRKEGGARVRISTQLWRGTLDRTLRCFRAS